MRRPPAIFIAVLFVVWVLVTLTAGLFVSGPISLDEFVSEGIGPNFALAAVLMLGGAVWLKWPGLQLPCVPGWGRIFIFPSLYLVTMIGGIAYLGLPPIHKLLILIVNTLLVGISEETMFRGFILGAFRQRLRLRWAVVLTSILFGAIHVLNGFATGDFAASSVQAVAAAMNGFLYVAYRLRTGSLWPGILFHALWDFLSLTLIIGMLQASGQSMADMQDSATASSYLMPLLLVAPLMAYGLWLMRPSRLRPALLAEQGKIGHMKA